MNIKEMSIDELMERRTAIAGDVEKDDADLDALEKEIREINAELETRKAQAQKKDKIRSAVANGVGVVVETKEEGRNTMENIEKRNTAEYIDAFAEYIKSGEDKQVRSLLSENGSGTVAVPDIVEDMVKTAWDKEGLMRFVKKTYIKGNVKVGFEKSATGATVHTEGGEAPDEETLVLGTVSLTPESIKKWITVSDEALDLRGEAFLKYIYDELTYRIAKKCADEMVAKVVGAPTTASATAVSVSQIKTAPALGTIAEAIGLLSDEAENPIIVMNKSTWAVFKGVQYEGNYGIDIFENLTVVFNNSLPAYGSASENGVYAIIGDFGHGAQANFPNGSEITIKVDDLSLAEEDLVKFVGREYVGLGLVADKSFVRLTKPATV